MDWVKISEQMPPDDGEYVRVKDKNGKEANAISAWTPFTEKRNPNFPRNRYKNIITPCEPVFDGFLVVMETLDEPNLDEITHWKPRANTPTF